MKKLLGIVAALALLATSTSHQALASIGVAGLKNTGQDANSNGIDDNYTVISPAAGPAYVYSDTQVAQVNGPSPTGVYPNSWVDNDLPNSGWIGVSQDILPGPAGGVTTSYSFKFAVTDAANWLIEGSWATDNSGEIFINGVTTGITKGDTGYSAMTPFSISNSLLNLLVGTHTIEFRVTNQAGNFPLGNPSGLQVSFTPTPEPTTIVVWSGLAAIGGVVAYRRKKLA